MPNSLVNLVLTVTPSPSPSQSSDVAAASDAASANPWIPWITLGAALVAAAAALVGAYLQRKTGKEATENASRSAAAAEKSAHASLQAAAASEKSVATNAEIAEVNHRLAGQTALSQRYGEAAEQLGSTSAASRIAGVLGMSRLADSWPEQRQSCVDVLCAYLRMPCLDDPNGEVMGGDYQVRRAIAQSIQDHVRMFDDGKPPSETSWSSLYFDFTGATLRDFRLSACRFDYPLIFQGVTFAGDSLIESAILGKKPNFDGMRVQGQLHLRVDVDHPDAMLSAKNAVVESGGHLSFDSLSIGNRTWVYLDGLTIAGVVEVAAKGLTKDSAYVSMKDVQVRDGAHVVLGDFDEDKFGLTASLVKHNLIDARDPQKGAKIFAHDWTVGAAEISLHQALVDAGVCRGTRRQRAPMPRSGLCRKARSR